MRHGAQFVIQNSKFLIRPRFSSERRRWQMVGVYEICPCEGLPGVADVAGVLDGGGGEANRVAFDGGGGRMEESVLLGYLEA